MSKKPYMTSDDIIASVKRRAMIPEHQATFSADDFLAFADEEMAMGIVPSILKNHEDYLLYTEKIPLDPNQRIYSIPQRAVGNKLREVSIQDGSGNYFELSRIGVGQLPYYNYSSLPNPRAFYIENNNIILVGNTSTGYTGSLVVHYYMRPNQLVLLEQVAAISAIDRNTGVITFTNIPENFNLSSLYDLVSIKSPNKTLGYDLGLQDIDVINKTATMLPETIPSGLSVGDHLCLANTTAIPQVPSDLHVYLVQRIVSRCLEALGDMEGLQASNVKVGDLAAQTDILITSRVEDAPKKIVAMNGPLPRSRFFRRRRF